MTFEIFTEYDYTVVFPCTTAVPVTSMKTGTARRQVGPVLSFLQRHAGSQLISQFILKTL